MNAYKVAYAYKVTYAYKVKRKKNGDIKLIIVII